MKKIECKYCGWGWNENEGGDDKYVCHMCGNDNARFYDNITEAEEPKKKLFRPIGLSGEDSRWLIWNKEQPIKDGIQINQYTHDGKKDGYWEYYYGDGKLETKGSYKDNNKEGYWEEYYPNDQLSSKGSFINGKKDGYWETYWVNGKLHSKGSYVNGESDGYWENYYWPNGKLHWRGLYVNGKRDGVFEYYLKDGKLYRKELYKDGELAKRLPLTEAEEPKKKLFRPIGLSGEDSRWLKLNKEQPIKDGVQINQYTHDGKKDGYWEEHYGSGKLKGKGTYINGKRDGVWEEYWEKGPLFFKALYVNGKRDGYSEQYWWNGKLDAKGSYKDKNKEGYWEEYYFNGKLATKGSYKNGMMDGIWEFYTEKGELDSKELYKDNELVKRLPLTESETPKKKLFAPIGLSGEDSRWAKWNKEQPIVDGKPINQYTDDGKETGYWEYYYEDGELASKGSYVNGEKDGIWKVYYSIGKLYSKGSYVNGKREGLWEWYWENGNLHNKVPYNKGKANGVWEWYYKDGKLYSKVLYKDGKNIKELPLTESEEPKKKLFRPIDLDKRYSDLLNTMITTEYYIGPYLQRRDSYIELKKELDPLVMELPNDKLILFVKANPFWLNSIEKVEYLLNKLDYKDNKDIAEHHIGQSFAKGGFFATPELKYYEQKFKKPKSSYGKIDTYVFVGSDNFVETKKGSYKKVFDIERLMKVSLDDWKDTKDYDFGKMLKFMQLRAQANNKGLYKITANKGLLDDYEGKAGDEIPEYILSAIDQKKERL